jgi:hypothetical protein
MTISTTDSHVVAQTALFIASGMRRQAKKYGMKKDPLQLLRDTNNHESMIDSASYIAMIAMILTAMTGELGNVEYPGVFDYEVSEEVGIWLVAMLHLNNKLPENTHMLEVLAKSIQIFFFYSDDVEVAAIRTKLQCAGLKVLNGS